MSIEEFQTNDQIEVSDEVTVDEQVNLDIEKNKENEFLYSFDISPAKRFKLRKFIKYLKYDENDADALRPNMYALNNYGAKFSSDILKTVYVRNLIQNAAEGILKKGERGYPNGSWLELKEHYGLSNVFFKNNYFKKYQKDCWLKRIEGGELINDADRVKRNIYGDIECDKDKDIEKEIAIENLELGPFEKSGVDVFSVETKQKVLEGLVRNAFFEHNQEYTNSVLVEYKKLFSISEEEYEQAVIKELIKEKLDEPEDCDKMRKQYPFVEQFLASPSAKKIAIEKVSQSYISGYENTKLIDYFSLKPTDFNYTDLNNRKRLKNLGYLIERITEKSGYEYLFYDIEKAQDILRPEDWSEIIKKYGQTENFINGVAYGMRFSFLVDKTLAVLNKIDLPNCILKKAGQVAIEYMMRDKDGVRYGDIAILRQKIGFSEQEYKEAVTRGVIVFMGFNKNRYEIDRACDLLGVDEMSDSQEIQNELKCLYLSRIKSADLDELEYIDSKFKINWSVEDRPIRSQAIKDALCNESCLRSFKNAKDIKKFIDNYYPETHKFFITANKEVCRAVENMLRDFILSESYADKSPNFFNEVIKIFGISREKLIDTIKSQIVGGHYIKYANGDNKIDNFKTGIDLWNENEKCLASHGSRIIEEAFESEDWKTLKDIMKGPNKESIELIQKKVAEQESILKNSSKSAETRLYAIEAVCQLGNLFINDIENNYFKDLVEIYAQEDITKLFNLFKQKTELFENLPQKTRDLAFDTMLDSKSTSSFNCEEFKQLLFKNKLIAYLNNNQLEKVTDHRLYVNIISGLATASHNNIPIPEDAYNVLYSRLISPNDDNIGLSATPEFINNIKKIWKPRLPQNKLIMTDYGSTNDQPKGMFKIRVVLKTLAANPDKFDVINKLATDIDHNIIENNWSWIYENLNNETGKELDKKINLINGIKDYSVILGKDYKYQDLYNKLISCPPNKQDQLLSLLKVRETKEVNFSKEDWAAALYCYIDVAEQNNQIQLKGDNKIKLLNLFNSDYKDVVFDKMYAEWINYIKNYQTESIPLDLYAVSRHIDSLGGAGVLKYVESLGNFIYQVNKILENNKTADRTKKEMTGMLVAQENRMTREKWAQDDKSEFYNLSHDIIEAAPSLYTAFEALFSELSAKEMKIIMGEILPLYQAQLVTLQKVDDQGDPSYQSKDLAMIRLTVRHLAENLNKNPNGRVKCIIEEKARLIEVIKDSFKTRFGVVKIPEEFTKDHIRSVSNCVRYIGNINKRDETKEAIIALFLGLELNNEWSSLRENKKIKPEEYLSGRQLKLVQPILEEKYKGINLPLEVAGVGQDKAELFNRLLQEEVMSNMIGSIETVDIKLGNIKRNIDELADPDIYPNRSDQEVMRLLQAEGKLVGSVLAKTFGSLDGKNIVLDDREKVLQAKVAKIFNVSSWTKDKVKQIQDRLQPFSLVSNMIAKMQEEKVEENINGLREKLTPSSKIIEVFNRLGESFTQTSGALALGKDISYLENLMVKDESKISAEEKKEVEKYLFGIKEKMKELEATLEKVKEYFIKIKKSSHLDNHELLKNRLVEIEKIINSESSSGMVVSRLTKDLNLIIENMRQCLGCLRREINNDTNLAFGDYNKFFIINQGEKDKGSISDEIVFFLPVKYSNGDQDMSFVMDNVYGSKSSDVLVSNIMSVVKKQQLIKKEIPEAKISVTVSNAAMSSVGLNAELLQKKLNEKIPGIKMRVLTTPTIANVPKSSFSDNYIEFAGEARSTSDRQLSGLNIY